MCERVRNESQSRRASVQPGVCREERFISPGRWASALPALVLMLLFSSLPSFAQDSRTINPGDILTLSRAIEIALKTQPTILGARYTVRANEARVGEARSNYYPQLNASGSYSRYSSITTYTLAGVPASGGSSALGAGTSAATNPGIVPTSTGAFNEYTGGLGVNQVVYDFGKTSTQVRINKLNTDAARFDLANIRQTVVLNVKQAYYDVLQTQRNAEVASNRSRSINSTWNRRGGFSRPGPGHDST